MSDVITPVPEEPPMLMHGGAIDAASARYRIPREDWLDLSTGINPFSYPRLSLEEADVHRLPDALAQERLRRAAARYYGVPDGTTIVGVPGSQAAIQWLPRLVKQSRVAVVSPTYAEHQQAWRLAGHEVVQIERIEDIQPGDGLTAIVLANPNNPDGRTYDPDTVLSLADRYLVIVDEAFCDLVPELSTAGNCDRDGLVVLKSVGKFFGLAGLRLGFVISADGIAARLQHTLGPWPVSGPALRIGASALCDEAWIRSNRERVRQAGTRMRSVLETHGLKLLGGTDLFSLIEHPCAAALFEHFARSAILTRRFDDHPTWLRIGLPGHEADLQRLEAAIVGWNAGIDPICG
ncbi:MAG: threonine-phosphate decarboxylase [Hyphomicrobiales bacterium]|nr:threonine-phosphate decarboxylase [Hyphomicrobiales bacterium]